MGKRVRPPNHGARELIQHALGLGYSWELSGKGHLVFRHPQVPGKIIASGTPGSPWSDTKARCALRRALQSTTTKEH
jgi:hypothetical protein